MFCPCYLRIVKKNFVLLTVTIGEILPTLRFYLKIVHRKNVSYMNPKVFLFNTALSAQLPCLAGLSL